MTKQERAKKQGPYMTAWTLTIFFTRLLDEVIVESGFQPEIGFKPDTWRRRKDSVINFSKQAKNKLLLRLSGPQNALIN
jgi:hypothetical protein